MKAQDLSCPVAESTGTVQDPGSSPGGDACFSH